MTKANGVHSTQGPTAPEIPTAEIIKLPYSVTRGAHSRKLRRRRQKSFYELYPMPFFDRVNRNSWDVTPTGNYDDDCETGAAFAVEFLRSCDKTNGWCALLQQIVADMIRAGASGQFADGRLKVNGIVIGFMGVVGRAVAHSRVMDASA